MKTGITASFLLILAALSLLYVSCDVSESETDGLIEVRSETELISALSAGNDLIVIRDNFSINQNLVIPEGTTLLLPIDEEDRTGFRLGSANASGKLATTEKTFVTVTLMGKMTVNGNLIIGGTIGKEYTFSYQGHTSSDHSRLINNGTLIVGENGTLSCYGFITGTGVLRSESGSKITEPAVITDFTGGDTLFNLYNSDQGLFNRYSLPNVQCRMEIVSGTTMIGHLELFIRGEYIGTDIKYVGDNDAFIRLSKGSVAIFEYDPAKSIESTTENNLHSDIGKTTLTLRGGAVFDSIEMSLQIMGKKYDLSYANIPFSIPYSLDIVLDNGVYLMNNIYRILPGSEVAVKEDASLNVCGSLAIYSGLNDVIFKSTKYPTTAQLRDNGFETSGRLVICGSLYILDGSELYGIVEKRGDKATITTSANYLNEEKEIAIGCNVRPFLVSGETHSYSSQTMAGYVVNNNMLVKLEPDRTYRSSGDCTYLRESFTQKEYAGPDYKNLVSRTYALNSIFTGGWQVESIVYPALELRPGVPPTKAEVLDLLNDTGISAYYTLKISLPSEITLDIDKEVIEILALGHANLSISLASMQIFIPGTFLQSHDTSINIVPNADIPNEKQKEAIGNKTVFSVSINTPSGKIELLNGGIGITLGYLPDAGTPMDKLQIWHISETGAITSYSASYSEGRISANIPCSGMFAISFEDPPEKPFVLDKMEQIVAIAIVIVLAIGLVGMLAYLIHKSKKKN